MDRYLIWNIMDDKHHAATSAVPKIIARPTSSNFWWGVYGFCEKIAWEDIVLINESGEKICGLCINGKAYLRAGQEELKEYPENKEYMDAVDRYLSRNECHFWYFYSRGEDVYEVAYHAPKNEAGRKPSSTEVWHTDEVIGLSSIRTAVQAFAAKHLQLVDCEVEIPDEVGFEEALQAFKEHQAFFGGPTSPKVVFTEELVADLSTLWKLSEETVLNKLNRSIA